MKHSFQHKAAALFCSLTLLTGTIPAGLLGTPAALADSQSINAYAIGGTEALTVQLNEDPHGSAEICVYKNGNLVKHVFTDEEGDTNFSLSEGTYKVTIAYDGEDIGFSDTVHVRAKASSHAETAEAPAQTQKNDEASEAEQNESTEPEIRESAETASAAAESAEPVWEQAELSGQEEQPVQDNVQTAEEPVVSEESSEQEETVDTETAVIEESSGEVQDQEPAAEEDASGSEQAVSENTGDADSVQEESADSKAEDGTAAESTENTENTESIENTEDAGEQAQESSEEVISENAETAGDAQDASKDIQPETQENTESTENTETAETAETAEVQDAEATDVLAEDAELQDAPVSTLALSLTTDEEEGLITVTVYGAASGKSVTVQLSGNTSTSVLIPEGNGIRTFINLTDGTYVVTVDYTEPVEGISPISSTVTFGTAPEDPTPIKATASVTGTSITVSVNTADDSPVKVVLTSLSSGSTEEKTLADGTGSVTFSGLAAGTYRAEASYTEQTADTCTLSDLIVSSQKIVIASVTGGENVLNVSGSAAPNSTLTFSTTPATSSVTAVTASDGSFSFPLVVAAGTYTAVSAQYDNDTSTLVTKTGSFTVTSPSEKPDFSYDAITKDVKKTAASTAAGITVKLTIGSYSDTETADDRGIVYFSLPKKYAKGTSYTYTVYYGKNDSQSFKVTDTVKGSSGYSDLEKGDSGSDVKELTRRLKELGYLKSSTSYYDSTVEAAVLLFQKNNGLHADGEADEETQETLFSVSAIALNERDHYPTLERGDSGKSLIYVLQRRLKDLGYYYLKVDGIYGSGTERAVRRFQEVNGLTPTGRANSTTQRLLYSTKAKSAKDWDDDDDDDYDTLRRSSRYKSAVVRLQRRLKDLGYYKRSVDGIFGSGTYLAVREFQRRNGLSVTGVADAKTQRRLYSSDARKASSSGSGSSYSYRLLYWGCTGSDVIRLQKALYNAGYTQVGYADGIYGANTYNAVRAFQRSRGLSTDGIAGRKTQNALYGTSY